MSRLRTSLIFLSIAAGMQIGCETYDSPPTPFIEGAESGVLADNKAPLVVSFNEPVDPATISIKIVRVVTDVEGNLADEDADPNNDDLPILFSFDKLGDSQGTSELLDGNSRMRITPNAPLPIGPKLAVLVEKGLKDLAGNETTTRKRLTFGYSAKVECNAPSTVFAPGNYFMLADIKAPLKVQVQLWGYFEMDPLTGAIHGQCTNADRNKTTQCPTPCESTKVCRLLPSPACVAPSEKAGTVDEYSDYVPNETPPTGYSFGIDGCVQDQPDGSVTFVTAPTEVIVQQPAVTLRNVTLAASLNKDAMGVVRGGGSLVADEVLIGINPSGKGEGGLDMRWVSEDEAPKNIPHPAP